MSEPRETAAKPRVAVFKMASCDGCQLSLLDCEDELLTLTGGIEIAHFLEASGAVSAEDEIAIGGFERIMGPNGEAQYYARSLVDAYRILYEHYRFSYVVPGESGPRLLAVPSARSHAP